MLCALIIQFENIILWQLKINYMVKSSFLPIIILQNSISIQRVTKYEDSKYISCIYC